MTWPAPSSSTLRDGYKALNEKLSKCEKDKIDILREHNLEVKYWKKELGNMTKQHKKLWKKFEALEEKSVATTPYTTDMTEVLNEDSHLFSAPTTPDMNIVYCSICAVEISDHVQEYFCGEPFYPVCDKCKADANLDDSGLTPDAFSSLRCQFH